MSCVPGVSFPSCSKLTPFTVFSTHIINISLSKHACMDGWKSFVIPITKICGTECGGKSKFAMGGNFPWKKWHVGNFRLIPIWYQKWTKRERQKGRIRMNHELGTKPCEFNYWIWWMELQVPYMHAQLKPDLNYLWTLISCRDDYLIINSVFSVCCCCNLIFKIDFKQCRICIIISTYLEFF